MSFVISCRALILVSHAMPYCVVKQNCDLARRSCHRLLLADPRRKAPIKRAEGRVTSANRDGSKTQKCSGAAGGSACSRGQQLATRDLVAWGETEPRREVLGALPGAQVCAAFGDQFKSQRWAKAVDLRQVWAQRSYLVWMRRQSLSFPNMFSILWR